MTTPIQRLEELFHAARTLTDARARAAFLDAATDGDTALRRRVEALLEADQAADDAFLAAPAVPAPATSPVGERAGDTIGHYKLLQEIGEGGMGTVWMAEQREPVVRKVALKIIKLGMDTREVIVRFEAERQALALMDHPHIAKVLDGGATASGRPYFVMELVKGVPITEYCAGAKLGLRDRLELFSRVCEAIQHAHHKGIIHRDIKPSNVLVTLHDGVPVPRVIDFGIAKATSAELTKKTLFTQYAQILGTPEYMAPEQAEMSGLDIDTRADVYSLGVLLYELLTGTKPFDIKTALASGFDELLRTIREVDPAKPSTRVSTLERSASPVAADRHVNVEWWSRRLRGDLDWIVMKALEKDRSRRYESPSNFAADIARYLRDESVSAAPPSAVYRLRKLVRRRRKTVVAVLLVALSLVGGIVGTSFGLVRALDEKERADLATQNEQAAKEEALASAELAQREAKRASEEAQRARAAEAAATERAAELDLVAQFQATQIARVDPRAMGRELRQDLLAALPEQERTPMDTALSSVNFTNIALAALDTNLLQPFVAAIDERFAGTPLVQSRLLLSVAQTMRQLGLPGAAADPVQRAFDIAVAQLGPDHPNTLTVLASLAELCFEQGRFDEAKKLYTIAFERRRAVLGEDDPLTWSMLYSLGKIARARGRFDDAERAYRESNEQTARLLGAGHRDTLVGLGALCALLHETGRVAEAEEQMRDLLERYRRLSGEQSPDYLSAALSYSSIVADVGATDEAEKYARAALAGFRELYGDEHASTLDALSSLGVILQQVGRFDECLPILTEVHTKRVRVLGAEHPSTLLSALNLGSVLREVGRLDEADPLLREAHDGLLRSFGAEYPDALVAANRIGGLRVSQGRVEEGVELLKVSIEATRRVFGDDASETSSTLNELGSALWMLDRPAEAVPYLELSHAGARRAFGEDHPNTAITAANLGVNLCASGRLAEGVAHLEAAWRVLAADPSALWIANALMKNLIAAGRRDDAVAVAHEALGKVRALLAGNDGQRANALDSFGNDFLGLDDLAGAEDVLTECVELRERLQPDAWSTFVARSMLGEALLRQGRFAEAEPHLLAAQAGLAERVAPSPQQTAQLRSAAGARLVALYDRWHAAEPDAGHAARADEWRAKLQQ